MNGFFEFLNKNPKSSSIFLFLHFVQTVKEERIIFIIDEGQFIDSASWAFMEKLIRTVPIFIIMSLSPFTDTPCAAARTIMKNRNATYVTLGALQPKDIRNKVCLDLNVRCIPKELDTWVSCFSLEVSPVSVPQIQT